MTTSPPTAFLAKLLGVYFLLFALCMVAQKPVMIQTMTALIHSPVLMFIIGAALLPAGLAVVIGHNVWSGGVLPVVVTVVGWLATLKGLFFLFSSPGAAVSFYGALHFGQFFYLYVVYVVLFGAYLTYAGFTYRRSTAGHDA